MIVSDTFCPAIQNRGCAVDHEGRKSASPPLPIMRFHASSGFRRWSPRRCPGNTHGPPLADCRRFSKIVTAGATRGTTTTDPLFVSRNSPIAGSQVEIDPLHFQDVVFLAPVSSEIRKKSRNTSSGAAFRAFEEHFRFASLQESISGHFRELLHPAARVVAAVADFIGLVEHRLEQGQRAVGSVNPAVGTDGGVKLLNVGLLDRAQPAATQAVQCFSKFRLSSVTLRGLL